MVYTLSNQKIELFPTMHHGSSIDLRDPAQNSFFEFGFGFDPDLPQEGMRHLAKERFHQIEPGAVLGRVNITKAVGSGCQVGTRLLGDVSRMIIQNNPDRHPGRIIGVQVFEQRDELPAAMSLLYPRYHVPVLQIQRSQDRKSPM